MSRRVVVTGVGVCSPIGNSQKEIAESLAAGKSGIKKMTDWDQVDGLKTKVGGSCDIDEKSIPRKLSRTMGRVALLSALSTRDAVADSGLAEDIIASSRCGISFGSTEGSPASMQTFLGKILQNKSMKGIPSSSYLQFMSHTCAANLAIMFSCKGPVVASCTACTSGSQGIGFGYQQIKFGMADFMIAGGAEELHFMDAGVFDIMKACSKNYNDTPDLTPRPFDAKRDGLVVSEGSGTLILEEYEHAKKRGAVIYAEIIGYGTNCDGGHLTNPDPVGMAGGIEAALKDASLSGDKIDHVNAHATATDTGDVAESKATYSIFKDTVPVSGFKGYIGHTLGAAGSIESIISLIMMENNIMYPTRNLEEPDELCAPINHVIGSAVEKPLDIVMNNNFAFGGVNTSLIFKKI